MDSGFTGEGEYKIDGKGRVSVPAPYRPVIRAGDPSYTDGNARMQMVYGLESKNHIDFYTMTEFNAIVADVKNMKRGSKKRKIVTQSFVSPSQPIEVDGDGRMTLPIELRKRLGIDGHVKFVSAVDHFQIWKPEVYEGQQLAQTMSYVAEQGDDFDPLALLEDDEEDE